MKASKRQADVVWDKPAACQACPNKRNTRMLKLHIALPLLPQFLRDWIEEERNQPTECNDRWKEWRHISRNEQTGDQHAESYN